MFHRVNELWRVGYHADPLSVLFEYQGSGRFDDPQQEYTVLYGSDNVETCIIESALPWSLHVDASYHSELSLRSATATGSCNKRNSTTPSATVSSQ